MNQLSSWHQSIRARKLSSVERAVSLIIVSVGMTGCGGGNGSGSGAASPQPDPPLNQSINHIIFMVQENRGFDHYFGHLPDYWAANGFSSQQFDAEPANASNPTQDGSATIQAFHFRTVCMQNMSPGWNESHVDWNRADPVSDTATLDGFVQSAASLCARLRDPGMHLYLTSKGTAPWVTTMGTT
jgi:phospholipase C